MKLITHNPGRHHGEILSAQVLANFRIFTSRHRPSLVVPSHTHDRACIGFVIDGQCEETLSGHTMSLRQHNLFFRPAGEIHANRSGRAGFHFLVAEVSDRWLEHVRDYAAVPREPICVGSAELSWLAMRLYREYSLGGFASPLAIEGMMLEIAAGLLRKQDGDPRLRGTIWLRRARDILHAPFHEPLGLSTLARCVGVHPVHLAREFRRHYGCTVGQYVRRLRVEAASRLLVESESSLVAIALEVGFANQAHFCRIFKLQTGLSPARYRSCSRGVGSRHNVSIRKGMSAAQR